MKGKRLTSSSSSLRKGGMCLLGLRLVLALVCLDLPSAKLQNIMLAWCTLKHKARAGMLLRHSFPFLSSYSSLPFSIFLPLYDKISPKASSPSPSCCRYSGILFLVHINRTVVNDVTKKDPK